MNSNVEKYVIAACIATLVGVAVGASMQSLLPWLTDSVGMHVGNISAAMLAGRILATLPISIVCAIWLWKGAVEEGRSRWAWMFFGLAFTLPGVAVFYGVAILQRLHTSKWVA